VEIYNWPIVLGEASQKSYRPRAAKCDNSLEMKNGRKIGKDDEGRKEE
jgi:hypothetical protein